MNLVLAALIYFQKAEGHVGGGVLFIFGEILVFPYCSKAEFEFFPPSSFMAFGLPFYSTIFSHLPSAVANIVPKPIYYCVP